MTENAPETTVTVPDPATTPDETAPVVADNTPAKDEGAATFAASTDEAVVPAAVASTPGNVPTPDPAPVESGLAADVRDVERDVTDAEGISHDVSTRDVVGLLREIHAMVSDIHETVNDVKPSVKSFVSQLENGGIGSLFAGMFGGRR